MSGDQLNLDAIEQRANAARADDPWRGSASAMGAWVAQVGSDVPALVAEVRRLRAEVADLRLSLAAEDDDDEPFPARWHGLTLTPWKPMEPTE